MKVLAKGPIGTVSAALVAAVFVCMAAHAQSVMPWYGAATVGHAPAVNGIPGQLATGLRDAGSSTGGCPLTFNCGITDLPLEPLGAGFLNGTYQPLAIYDNQTSTGNYHSWTLGYVNGVPTMTLGTSGSANAVTALTVALPNGTTFTLPGAGTSSGLPFVIDNSTLKQTASTFSSVILREDFTAGGGAPPVYYRSSASACSLNSGAGDGGSQVASSDSKCWIALPGQRMTPLDWGAVGNGTTDDTTALQNAVNWSAANGLPLSFDNSHKFLISTQIGITSGSPILVGSTPVLGPYSTSCPAGIIVNSNINALSFTSTLVAPNSLTYKVTNLCIQMATAAGTRTSGAAFTNSSTGQVGSGEFSYNTIIFPFDGIVNNGNQTNSPVYSHNLIISPSDRGIWNGSTSVNNSSGIVANKNQIYCNSSSTFIPNAIGVENDDGGGTYDFGTLGPYKCNVGFQISPGASQIATLAESGVIGDSSLTNDLLIKPVAGSTGLAEYTTFSNWETGIIGATTGASILLQGNTTSGGTCSIQGISFTGGTTHGNTGTGPIVDFEGDMQGVVFANNIVVAEAGGTGNTGLKLANASINCASGYDPIVITGNYIGSKFGTLATGIALGTSNNFSVTDNHINNATTPISWTWNAGADALIRNNVGVPFEFGGPISNPTCTGIGSTGTCTLATGSSLTHGRVQMTPGGTGIAATGNITIAIDIGLSAGGPLNTNVCAFNLLNVNWNGAATVTDGSAGRNIIGTWANNAVLLTAATPYTVSYRCDYM